MTRPKTAPKPPAPDAPAAAPATPLAFSVHEGHDALPEHTEQLIIHWLKANRINPAQVSVLHPILVVPVPVPAPDGGAPYLVQVIVFHQFYVGPDGEHEDNMLTRRAVSFQRTVPLTVAFPQLPEPAQQPVPEGQAGDAPQPSPQQAPEEDDAS